MKMTFKTILFGSIIVFFVVVSAVVFAPRLTWNPTQTTIAHPYTDYEEKGREVFYSNGCNYCHTQYVRLEDTAMGPVSDGGNYYFDNPMILGSERTGPDLSYLGHKRSEQWDVDHLNNPREMSPLSIMPSFSFLSDEDKQLAISYLWNLGDRVAMERMILPPAPYQYIVNPLTYSEVPITLAPTSGSGWTTYKETGLANGKEIYVKYCLTCHGDAGNGLGSYGGTMSVTPADFKQNPINNMPDDQWFWHVSEGVPGTFMPTWKLSLSENDRWDVIRYIQRTFAMPIMHDPNEGDPIPPYDGVTNPLPITTELLDEGKAIYDRECVPCHGDAGRGSGPYRAVIQPGPPDFGDGSYAGSYIDADYFWRISEGVPWTAMPTWKLQYGEEDRWKLVHFIRATFIQDESMPEIMDPSNKTTPQILFDQRMPDTASFERGSVLYIQNCAHCHGLAGDGMGWDGLYLNPQPADLHELTQEENSPENEGIYFTKLTVGIHNAAMPVWGETLTESERWDAVKFIFDSFMTGTKSTESVYNGQISAEFLLMTSDMFLSEGHIIDQTQGQPLYEQYCATCHGDNGQGNGPGTVDNVSGSPAAFPSNMTEDYVYWRIWEGVPNSIMEPFKWLLDSQQTWEITTYLTTNAGGA